MIQALNLEAFCVVAECLGNKPYPTCTPTWAVQNANGKDARTLSDAFILSCNLFHKYILQEKMHLKNPKVKNHIRK